MRVMLLKEVIAGRLRGTKTENSPWSGQLASAAGFIGRAESGRLSANCVTSVASPHG
jgi:hypothetical protein